MFIFGSIGTYHQYDNVAYPKTVKTSDTSVQPKDIKTSKTLFQSFKALFRSRSVAQPQEEEEILSPLEMGRLCLQVYLDGYKQMLCSGSFPQQANLKMIVEEIFHIFYLLYCPIICHQNSSQPVTQSLGGKFTEVRSFHSISQLTAIDEEDFFFYIQVMKEWLESVVDALRDGAAGNTMNQLASALCVTHCLLKVGIFNLKVDKLALSLVGMLQLKHNSVKKECPDYEYLCEILPTKYR